MTKEKTSVKMLVKEIELNMSRFNIQELWAFTLKEICLNLKCSTFDFCMDSKRYNDFKRRFNYFVKRKRETLV